MDLIANTIRSRLTGVPREAVRAAGLSLAGAQAVVALHRPTLPMGRPLTQSGPAPNWFVALPVPKGTGWLDAAGDGLPKGIRRFVEADIHFTVAFLGACGKDNAERAWNRLVNENLGVAPIRAAPEGWKAMGTAKQPSAYALTLKPDVGGGSVAALIHRWRPILLEAAGCRPDRRPALPPVTLARPGRKDARRLAPVMHQWMATAPVPQSNAVLNKIALYTWAEDRSARLFQVVAEQELGEVS